MFQIRRSDLKHGARVLKDKERFPFFQRSTDRP